MVIIVKLRLDKNEPAVSIGNKILYCVAIAAGSLPLMFYLPCIISFLHPLSFREAIYWCIGVEILDVVVTWFNRSEQQKGFQKFQRNEVRPGQRAFGCADRLRWLRRSTARASGVLSGAAPAA